MNITTSVAIETDHTAANTVITFQTTKKNSQEYSYRTHTWDLSNQLDLDTYLQQTSYEFEYAGSIVSRDDEEDKPIHKLVGYKINVTDEYNSATQILYLLVINGKIVKGGKVKGTLPSRSYSAGTEHNWTNTGQASPTNYIYSQIFRSCLSNNIPIKFYVYKCPLTRVSYLKPDGQIGSINISPYEEMEKSLNADLKQTLGTNLIGEGDLLNLNKM